MSSVCGVTDYILLAIVVSGDVDALQVKGSVAGHLL